MTRSINNNSNWEKYRYKLFWIGNEIGNDRVGIFVAKKWIEQVLEVK